MMHYYELITWQYMKWLKNTSTFTSYCFLYQISLALFFFVFFVLLLEKFICPCL